jgi:hypothetical protein
MADEIARYRYGVVLENRDPAFRELRWLSSSAEMTDEDWMAGLMILAAETEGRHTSAILVDATDFQHRFADREATMAWRDDRVIPRYNRAGIQRFAFVMPDGFPGPTAESGAEPRRDGPAAEFPTHWFLDRGNALAWLGS